MKEITVGPGGDYATLQAAMNAGPEDGVFVLLEGEPASMNGYDVIVYQNSAGWTVKLTRRGCGTRADGFGRTLGDAVRNAQRAMTTIHLSLPEDRPGPMTSAELRAYLRGFQQQPPPEEQ